jgi:hypothetical protein
MHKFFVILFYLQSVAVHSVNCVQTYIMACRRVFNNAPLYLTGSRTIVNFEIQKCV